MPAALLSAQAREVFTTGMAESLRWIALLLLLAALLVIAWPRPHAAERTTSQEQP
ncbi:hypothetical protein [Streptomyces sp. NPDC003247]|uniref:hypothetical protein n=1 Tax=Streptomyces sp. NPDC003247 TaxID=3364677 RepID=UPI0036A2F340